MNVALPSIEQGAHATSDALIGPLLLAGLGNGLVIAPNQEFVLASVPREQAGTAGGALITAQRLGAAIGIAVIGTALFGGSGASGGSRGYGGSGGGSSGSGGAASRVIPALAHNAQAATLVNLCFIIAALLCTFGLPRTLDSGGGSGAGRGRAGGRKPRSPGRRVYRSRGRTSSATGDASGSRRACHDSIHARAAAVDAPTGGATMDYSQMIERTGEVIDVAGVVVIAVGAVLAAGTAAVRLARHEAGNYRQFRQQLGQTILLGLELLVAADIVRTVAAEPTFASVGVLGIIVLIRTFLSFSLEVELTGRWPWQKKDPPAPLS